MCVPPQLQSPFSRPADTSSCLPKVGFRQNGLGRAFSPLCPGQQRRGSQAHCRRKPSILDRPASHRGPSPGLCLHRGWRPAANPDRSGRQWSRGRSGAAPPALGAYHRAFSCRTSVAAGEQQGWFGLGFHTGGGFPGRPGRVSGAPAGLLFGTGLCDKPSVRPVLERMSPKCR